MEERNDNAPAVPEWADNAMRVAPLLIPESGPEQDLVDAAFILLRHRYGLSILPNAVDVARHVIETAVRKLDEEAGR